MIHSERTKHARSIVFKSQAMAMPFMPSTTGAAIPFQTPSWSGDIARSYSSNKQEADRIQMWEELMASCVPDANHHVNCSHKSVDIYDSPPPPRRTNRWHF